MSFNKLINTLNFNKLSKKKEKDYIFLHHV